MTCVEALALAEHLDSMSIERIRRLPPPLLAETLEQLREARYALTRKCERLINAELRLIHGGGYRHG